MSEVWIVLTTFGDEESAKRVAAVLLEERLAACVNLLPGATSMYHWKGEICEEREVVAVIKTTKEAFPELEKVLAAQHPYEIPEILAIPAAAGSEDYLNFVRKNVGR